MAAAVSTAGDGVGIDVCVANAGLLLIEDFVDGDVEGWRRIVDVNVIGTMVTVREAARAMIASGRGGRIVLIASNAGLRGEAGAAVYSATKGALVALMQGLAVELAGVGIRVNAVAPGEVDAGMNTAAMAKLAAIAQVPEEGFRSQVIERIPARRMASAQDVAAAVAFLASDDAAHVTGLALPVDGGQLLV
jgi:NAD(P)-dependent dehydrogenase (short-subunit alcohol dehydrogenase family)